MNWFVLAVFLVLTSVSASSKEKHKTTMTQNTATKTINQQTSITTQPTDIATKQPTTTTTTTTTNQPTTTTTKQPTTTTTKQPTTTTTKQPTTTTTKQPTTTTTTNQPTTTTTKQPTTTTTKQPTTTTQQQLINETTQQPIDVNTHQPTTKNTPQPTTKTTPQPTTNTTQHKTTQQPIPEETTQQPLTKTEQQPTTETAQQPTTKTTQQPIPEETTQQPLTKTEQQPTTETAQHSTTKITPQPTTNTTPQPKTKTTPQPTTKTTPQPTTKTTPQPTTKTTPQPTTKTTPQPTTKTTPQPTTKTTQQPTTKTTQQPTTKTTPQPTTKTTQQPIPEETTQQPLTKTEQQPTTETAQHSTTKITPQPTTNTTPQPTTKTTPQPTTKTTPQPTTKTTPQPTTKTTPQPTTKTTQQPTTKTTQQPTTKTTPQPTTKTTQQPIPEETTQQPLTKTEQQPTTETAQHLTTSGSSVYEGKLTISEVYFKTDVTATEYDMAEFVELYGDASMNLSGYALLFFSGPEAKTMSALSLQNYVTNANGSFVIAYGNVSNTSFKSDLKINNSNIFNPPVTMATIYKTDNVWKITEPQKIGLIDYVVYGINSSIPELMQIVSQNSKVVQISGRNPRESITRCFSGEPRDQRAFTLSQPTPGLSNDCLDIDLKINEIKYASTYHGHHCFIELLSSHNASLALNSYVLVLYTRTRNVIFDLWNMRTDDNGYFLLNGTLGSEQEAQALNCTDLLNDTMVIILYKITMDNMLKAPLPKDAIKQQLAYNTTSPLNQTLLSAVLDEEKPCNLFYLHDEAEEFLSGNVSLALCSSQYKLCAPTPGHANRCPVVMTTTNEISSSTSSVIRSTKHHSGTPQNASNLFINEITISNVAAEQFIELRGDKHGDVQSYYIAFFDGCNGDMLTNIPVNRSLDGNGFLKLDSEDLNYHIDFRQHLKKGDILAIGLYQTKPSSIDEDPVDAVAMMSSNHMKCTPEKAERILAKNSDIISFSTDDMKKLISLSRCSTNSKRDTHEFQVLKQSSPEADNIGCKSPDIVPKKNKSNKQIMVTVAVVVSCIAVFLVIVVFVVIIMKRKQRGLLKHFNMTRLDDDDDDDEELITNMENIDDLNLSGGEPTFQSQMYSKLRVKEDDDNILIKI